MTACSIAPPELLAHLEREGTEAQRAAARRVLESLVAVRERRERARLGAAAPTAAAKRTVHDCAHTTDLPGRLVWSEGEAPVADEAVNEAARGAGDTWAFYDEVFGRDSIDGKGMTIVSCVHYDRDYDNAFWDGEEMVYGDGSGQLFAVGALTNALDLIGHELTHGVTYLAATAIGGDAWEAPGRIWYEALTTRLRPDSDFGACVRATVDLAGDHAGAVRAAWQEVGVL